MKHAALEASGRILIEDVEVGRGALGRMRGYLGRGRPGPGRGLHLAPCGSVHTFGMRFPLDLIFLSKDGCVCRVVANVVPWRVAWGGWSATQVIETPAGWLDLTRLPVGTPVRLNPRAA